jgi:hypothetical protein
MEIQKHIEETEHAKLLYSGQNGSSGKNLPNQVSITERQVAVARLLWKRMRESFGQSWVREYGDANGDAFQTWLIALAPFSEKQIGRGVKSAQEWTQAFPPTLPQFKQMCLTVRPGEKPNFTEQRIEREKEAPNMIEHLASHAHSDIAKQELDKMRRIMAGEDVETR